MPPTRVIRGSCLVAWCVLAACPAFGSYVGLYHSFQKFLIDEYAQGRHVILVIDEAQNLGADTLEELRMLSNINSDKDQLVQLVLIGQPQLRDLLCQPKLVQFA